jgi:hypothetical protein
VGLLKHIPLASQRSDVYLSLGGSFRPRYEHLIQNNWGEDHVRSDGVYHQRATLYADLHLTRYFRAYGELLSAFAGGAEGGPSPVDRNDLDMGQLFVEPTIPLGKVGQFSMKVGRQRLDFASGRLVNSREGPNVYRAFDAVHPEVQLGQVRLSGIIARPVANQFQTFEDRTSRREWLRGAAIDTKLPSLLPGRAGLYYLFYQNDQNRYVQGVGEERRHSIGSRISGKRGPLDYDLEGVYQLGHFGSANIQAWTLATDTGYTMKQMPWTPRLGMKFHYASGDRNPKDNRLGSFNALFPKGPIVGEYAIIGPRNFINPVVSLGLHPTQKLSINLENSYFWRAQTADGIYNAAGRLLRGPENSRARYVATEASLIVRYRPVKNVELEAIYAANLPGAFIEQTGSAQTAHLFQLTTKYSF